MLKIFFKRKTPQYVYVIVEQSMYKKGVYKGIFFHEKEIYQELSKKFPAKIKDFKEVSARIVSDKNAFKVFSYPGKTEVMLVKILRYEIPERSKKEKWRNGD